ncbi:MAG: LysR substrate-binding domain-containing protein [Woeseiaceae bacterium]|nr:LysR substrate-binding domain-containing protein [Woeseiaceae bacterium]
METRLLTRLGTLRQLEIFLKVAEHHSMSRAAEELYLSHSAVSLQIRKLAEAIGLPLHEVIGKQLYLTEAGHEVAATGTQIFASIRRLDESINNLKGLTSGRLAISVVTTAKYFLPRILGPFCRDYPDIDLSFHVGNREEIIRRLNENLDDLYIFNGLPRELDIESFRFLPNPIAVIASGKHSLAGKKRLAWHELENEKFLMREPGSGTFEAIRRHLEANDLKLGKTMTIESNEAIKHAVVEDMGVTILSAYVLADAVGTDLVQLRVKGFPIMSDWYVVHPRAKQLSLIAERFLEFVLKKGPDVLPMENLERQVKRALAQA